MKKIIRYSSILTVFIITLIIASSCVTTNKISAPMPAPSERSHPFKVCKEFEPEIGCKQLGPTATGADRGFQEEPRELP